MWTAFTELNVVVRGVAQVRTIEGERVLKQSRVVDEHAPDLVGLEEPPVHEPAKVLLPVPIKSARTLIGLLGLPIRAKNRG